MGTGGFSDLAPGLAVLVLDSTMVTIDLGSIASRKLGTDGDTPCILSFIANDALFSSISAFQIERLGAPVQAFEELEAGDLDCRTETGQVNADFSNRPGTVSGGDVVVAPGGAADPSPTITRAHAPGVPAPPRIAGPFLLGSIAAFTR